MKAFKIAFVLVMGLAICAQCQTVNFLNGDFESYEPYSPSSPDFGVSYPGYDINIPAGSPGLTGWRVLNGGINIVFPPWWQAASGTASLDLNGWKQGGIEQNVMFTAVGSYKVTFMMSENTQLYGRSAQLGVYLESPGAPAFVCLGTFTFAQTTTASNMRWTPMETSAFSVAPGTYTFDFLSVAPGGPSGPTLDNVSLLSVSAPPGPSIPEPTNSALAAGLALLGLLVWRSNVLNSRTIKH